MTTAVSPILKAKMLTTGEKAEARIYQNKRKQDAEYTCQEPKRKKIDQVKQPKQRLLTFYSQDQQEKRKRDDTSTLVQKGIPKRQKTDGQDGIEQLDCSTHKGTSEGRGSFINACIAGSSFGLASETACTRK